MTLSSFLRLVDILVGERIHPLHAFAFYVNRKIFLLRNWRFHNVYVNIFLKSGEIVQMQMLSYTFCIKLKKIWILIT